MSNHAESSNTHSSSSSHYNTGSGNSNTFSFSNHHSFSLNPHFAATTGLNRLFNAGLDHSQAFLGFYHKSPTSIKTAPTTDDDNASENEGSLSNGSREQDQVKSKKRGSNELVDNDELSQDESVNPKSSSESS